MSLTGFKVRFTPGWKMCILTLLVMALFLRLGVWQLDRGAKKKHMLNAQSNQAKMAPMAWSPLQKLPVQYQKIKMKGYFLKHVLLLDNQHYRHQFGYDVFSPFVLANGHLVLVDRGWVIGEPRRQIFPTITTPTGLTTLAGSVYYPATKNFLLGPVLEKKQDHLAIIELVDTKVISQFLHAPVYPFVLRLGKEEKAGYIRAWQVVSMSPQRHYGYAVQWFVMALVIFIIFIVLNLKKKNETY